MSQTRLAAILDACQNHRPDGYWNAAGERIAAEREAVESLLVSGATVYGFTTLLGQLDRHAVVERSREQVALLQAHLVGPRTILPAPTARLVTACKLEQLAAGGSGVDPHSFRALINHFEMASDRDIHGCWASYGCGDVVPAAWWLNSLVEDESVILDHTGDAISLINGNFFSTAVALDVAVSFANFVGSTLAVLRACAKSQPADGGWEPDARDTWASFSAAPPSGRRTQLPVSLRDSEPVVRALLNAVVHLRDALATRLSSPSANPLFILNDGRASAVSQCSFLDFGLTFSLTEARQALLLALGVLQRVAHHVAQDRQTAASEPRQDLVQPPKIVAAYLAEAQSFATLPSDFVGDESEGIEDVRDLSLVAARALSLTLREHAEPGLSVVEALLSSDVNFDFGRGAVVELLAGRQKES